MTPKRTILSPGKLVLVGEYAVVDGAPAVVMAVDHGVQCDVHDGEGIEVPGGDDRFVSEALQEASGRFVFTDWNPVVLDEKPGFGGSAAACVAACVAADRPATDAYELHARAQGGGSGVDVAASIYGGTLLFERRRVIALAPVMPVVVYSGQSAKTGPRVQQYLGWSPRDGFVQQARRITYRFMEEPIEALQAYHDLLDQMVAAAGIDYWTPALRQICELARSCGGAAKPSGAGGGDSVVALFPRTEQAQGFREACQHAGFDVIPVAQAEGARAVTNTSP